MSIPTASQGKIKVIMGVPRPLVLSPCSPQRTPEILSNLPNSFKASALKVNIPQHLLYFSLCYLNILQRGNTLLPGLQIEKTNYIWFLLAFNDLTSSAMTIKDSVLFFLFSNKSICCLFKKTLKELFRKKKKKRQILSFNKLTLPLKGFAPCVDYSFALIILKCLWVSRS